MGITTDCTEGGRQGDTAHHWVIDGSNLGVCKKCGAMKQFETRQWNWQMLRDAYYKGGAVTGSQV